MLCEIGDNRQLGSAALHPKPQRPLLFGGQQVVRAFVIALLLPFAFTFAFALLGVPISMQIRIESCNKDLFTARIWCQL